MCGLSPLAPFKPQKKGLAVAVGLFAGGVIFNLLNEKLGSIYPSWLLHMCANFGINTVGFILLSV